jgi:hypothetical protein
MLKFYITLVNKHSPYRCNTNNHELVPEEAHCSMLLLQQYGLCLFTNVLQNFYTWKSFIFRRFRKIPKSDY